jgi:hypothetical protein
MAQVTANDYRFTFVASWTPVDCACLHNALHAGVGCRCMFSVEVLLLVLQWMQTRWVRKSAFRRIMDSGIHAVWRSVRCSVCGPAQVWRVNPFFQRLSADAFGRCSGAHWASSQRAGKLD